MNIQYSINKFKDAPPKPAPPVPDPVVPTPTPTPDPSPTPAPIVITEPEPAPAPIKAAGVNTTPPGTAANWKSLGDVCKLFPAPLMSDSCVTSDNKLAPNLKCCRGLYTSGTHEGTTTIFNYCVNTDNATFTVPGKEGTFNFDCREGAQTLMMSYLASFLLAVFLTQ
jgi:hypothetical protein